MKTKTFLISILATLVMCTSVNAQTSDPPVQNPLTLTDDQDSYPLGLNLEILKDPSGELTIEDVSSPEFDQQFVLSQVAVPNYGFTDSVYWVRFRLVNETSQNDEWLLEQGFANTQYVDLYTPLPDGGGFSVKQTGVLRPVSTRDVLHPRLIFNLSVPLQSQGTYYLHFQGGASMTLALTLWTKAAFLDHALIEQTFMGIFFGVLIGLLFYNLFLYFSLRETNYLFFVILLASVIFEDASYSGHLRVYIIPNLNSAVQYIEPVALPLMIGSLVLFSDSFLELKMRHPKLHVISLVILAVWGALMLLIPFTSYRILASLMAPWALISLVAVFIDGTVSWIGGYRPSRFFILAWLGLILSLGWVFLVRLGLAPSSIYSENAFRIGVLWMAVCFSIALADRINLLKAKTEAANLALRNSENRLSEILEGLPMGVVVYDTDQIPTYVNQRAIEILNNPDRGIIPDIAAGRSLAQAFKYYSLKVAGTEQAYPLETLSISRALRGKPATTDDIEADLGDRRVPLEIWASPIRNDSGDVESAVAAFQDITLRKQAELAQNISETRFRAIAENNPDGIAFLGRDRKVLYVSPSYLRLVGKTTEELIGQIGIGLVHPDDRDYTAIKFNEALQHPNTIVLAEYRIPHKDGSYIWVETSAINMLDNPYVEAVVLISHNIADRKQKEDELNEYRKHLEKLVEQRTAELNVMQQSLRQRVEWLSAFKEINQTTGSMADLPQAYKELSPRILSLLGARSVSICLWEDEEEQIVTQYMAQEDVPTCQVNRISIPFQNEFQGDATGRKDLITIPVEEAGFLPASMNVWFQDPDVETLVIGQMYIAEALIGLLGVGMPQPINEITPSQTEIIEKITHDLANLTKGAKLLDQSQAMIVTEERNILARELHDSVTQTLFTASILSEAIPRHWVKNQELALKNLERLNVLIRGALAEMRSLLFELHSGDLYDKPLEELLSTLAETVRAQSQADVIISLNGGNVLPDDVRLGFYRIAREALNNVVHHAEATQINISLVDKATQVELRIQDNGIGFDPQAIPANHLGIGIMAERAEQIGGSLSIQSETGVGTEIILTWSGEDIKDDTSKTD